MSFWIGAIAGLLTTAAFVPQVWRTWRTRSTRDLSLPMLVTFMCGIFGWLAYGIILRESPIVASNLITLVLTAMLIGMKLRFERATSDDRPIG